MRSGQLNTKMKKICLLLSILLLLAPAMAQVTVTVTNPTNTTPNLAGSYTSLANAISALDVITAISGPVILTCDAGNETAPAGGYIINFIAATTTTNDVVIKGTTTTTITTSPTLTAAALNDGVFKIIGSDHVGIQHFTMQENALNTITFPGTNNMTEWGVALLCTSVTNGAQFNTIQDNIISLNKAYSYSFGIYSNVRHNATTVNSIADITNSTTAPNNGNKIYSNTISNVNMGITFIGSGIALNQDVGNDIGGSSIATGNTISNWGGIPGSNTYVSNSGACHGIFINHQTGENVSYNTLASATITSANLTLYGIYKAYNLTPPTGTFSSAITNNTITLSATISAGTFEAIRSEGMSSLSTATMNINNNTILNCALSGLASNVAMACINNSSAPGTLNIINNVIRGNTSAATSGAGSFTGISNSGLVVNAINITNNQIGNAVAGAMTFSLGYAGQIFCISNTGAGNSSTINLNNNSIQGMSLTSYNGSMQFYGIYNSNGNSSTAININNNQLGTITGGFISFSGSNFNSIFGIYNNGGSTSSILTIQDNDFRGILHTTASNGAYALISSNKNVVSQNVISNTFTNLNINSAANIDFIVRAGILFSGFTWTCTNNKIVTAFNKGSTAGQVRFYTSLGSSNAGASMTETGNDFSNVTLANSSTLIGWDNEEGASNSGAPAKVITGNTFNNITAASGTIIVMKINKSENINCSANTITNINSNAAITAIYLDQVGGPVACSSNTISNISSTAGALIGIFIGSNNSVGTCNFTLNNISSLVSTGGGGAVTGILGGSASIPTNNISNNTIMGLSSAGSNSLVCGIRDNVGTISNVNDNIINDISGSATVFSRAYGIELSGTHTTANIFKNKIYDIRETGVYAPSAIPVSGIVVTGGNTVNVYNNFIADLKAPGIAMADAIQGIRIDNFSAASTNNKVYHNSIYINATSTGTDFGTSGIYHGAGATATDGALTLIDNIVVNTSTANGGGVTAAFRRNGSLINYNVSSDYNLFYAGIPGVSRLIYYDGANSDQTIAAFQTRVSTRDANSISTVPNFISSTDLHLTAVNCQIDGRGTPVASVTTDIDGAARNLTTPDIGADEFSASFNTTLAGVAGSAICESRTVSIAGTTFISNTCDLIAKVLPSGGAAVSGKMNTCVTLDATRQYFNAEPYVRRHFDIEPATSDPTTTTATITLYFDDADFVDFNTNTVGWPKLPTAAGGGSGDPNVANLKVTQYHGTATTSPSSPGFYTANGGSGFYINPADANIVWNGSYWAVTFDVTGFSGFYVHTNPSYALPVSFNYLNGVKQGDKHLLSWSVTCNTTPRVTLILERNADNRNFSGLYSITADALSCNQPFDYTDAHPLAGINYYRLKIVDADGKITYSNTIALINGTKGFALMNIAPNPVRGNSFKLNTTSATSTKMDVVISDMQGRIVRRQTVSLTAGFNNTDIIVNSLAPGTYSLYGITADDRSGLIRFAKQ